MGPVEGLSADDVKDYIRYIADRRLDQLGLTPYMVCKRTLYAGWMKSLTALNTPISLKTAPPNIPAPPPKAHGKRPLRKALSYASNLPAFENKYSFFFSA